MTNTDDWIRSIVARELKRYKKLKPVALEEIEYITLKICDQPLGSGTNNKVLENAIVRREGAREFCKSIETILKKIPETLRIILIRSYIHEDSDVQIYMDLEISERSYYYKKKKAIKKFYNIWLLKDEKL